MSGPKVFRIVSVNEARHSWQTWLVHAQSRLDYWVNTCQRIGTLAEWEEKVQRTRLARMQELVRTDNFDGLMAEGPSFLKHLEANLATQLENAANRNLAREKTLSSASITASVLLKMARESAVELPEQTEALLRQAVDRGVENLPTVEEAILSAAKLLQPTAVSPAATSESLASQVESVDDWLQRTGYCSTPASQDVQRQAVERLLCELTGLGHFLEVESFRRRVAAVFDQSADASHVLALEVLCQELQQTVEKARRWDELRQRAEELRAEAEHAGVLNAIHDAISAFDQAFEQRDTASASASLDVQRGALDAALALKNAESRRLELLNGLKQLGYVVNFGLLKIWTSQKQVIIRKSVQSVTGLELSGDMATGKCQARVVSLDAGAGGHAAVDGRLAEEQWCSELLDLQRDLGKRGVALLVERSTPAGVVPLKPAKCTWVSDFADGEAAEDGGQTVRQERQERIR
jgi:hypothetical protein